VNALTSHRKGLLCGLSAYLLWGVFPLYFLLVAAAPALEVIAHRVLWTLVLCLIGVTALRRWGEFRAVIHDRATLLRLVVAGVLVLSNWSIYVFAVLAGHVVDASLGYFINPLVTVMLAVVVLREKPRPLQLAALAIGGTAVLVVVIWYGQVPWVALLLALTFAVYGLIKKQVDVSPMVGLGVETTLLAPIGAGYIIFLSVTGASTLWLNPVHTAALFSAGVVTAAPLLLFAAAARRIPLTTVGLLQYACPVMQFTLGVTVFGEEMPLARWVGFALIWVALIVLTVDTIAGKRNTQPGGEPDFVRDAGTSPA
jgi:chloramphenicol-sensitive protein RarD